jgi:serine phosphatase RsbU (regulator of sigma subunit)
LNIRAQFYLYINDLDNATKFNTLNRNLMDSLPIDKIMSYPIIVQADILTRKKEYQKAIEIYKSALPYAERDNYLKDIFEINYDIANNYYLLNKLDSSLSYANKVVQIAKYITFTEGLLKNNLLLYSLYKRKGITDSALKYIEAAEEVRNNIFNNIKANDAQNMAINEEVKQRELAEQKAKQQKILIITAICAVLLAIGIYLNGKRKQKERLRQIEEERKNSELRAARDLQQSMLPKENPKRADLDIATFIRSSTEVGGDYYDFFPQADGSIFSVCGDATGHGVTSGMMVSVTKAGLNGISPVKPNKILQRLNGVVKRIDLGTLRMSLNIAEITHDEIYLSSAAMPPIYLYKAATKTIEEFMNNGLPLGGLRDEEFALEARNFESGDVLVQLSDGLPEAPNSKGDMYDYDRLRSLILVSIHLSSKQIIDVLMKSVDEWMEGQHNPDDITLVVTKKI